MQIIKENKDIFYNFDNIIELADYANVVSEEHLSKSKSPERDIFCGGSFEDAMQQAKQGNPELVQELFNGVEILNAMIEEDKQTEIRDVEGEYFDVGEYLSGEVEVFRRNANFDTQQVISVYANYSMDYTIENEVIKNRGCAIISMCDMLARNGFIVDLHLIFAGVQRRSRKKYHINIELSTNPLDLDTAAFILANALCLRRLSIAVMERATRTTTIANKMGVTDYTASDIFSKGFSGFYFCSSGSWQFSSVNYFTLNDAKEHILGMLEKFKSDPNRVVIG